MGQNKCYSCTPYVVSSVPIQFVLQTSNSVFRYKYNHLDHYQSKTQNELQEKVQR